MSEWWERFELETNPLTLRAQFSTPDHFNHLLVETNIFQKYKNLLVNPKNILNRVILITGEYGSGKTVLFDYIKFCLLRFTNIFQKSIFLGEPYPNSLVMKDDFLAKLYYEITGQISPLASEINIIKAVTDKKEELGLEGLVLVIDELHKNPEHQVTLEFLRHLQGFFQKIQEVLNFTIIVAGREEWVNRLKTNPQYSGTISDYEPMSCLEAEQALDIIQKRLIYYSKTKKAAIKNKLRISIEAMEKILQNITYRTPREVMIQVNAIFMNLKPEEEFITPYSISTQVSLQVLNLIRRKIKSKQFVKLNKILIDLKNELEAEDFTYAIRMLYEIYRKTSLTTKEWDNIHENLNIELDKARNIKIIALGKELVDLKEKKLIEKRQHGTVQITKNFYRIREDLYNFFKNIEKNYNLNPEDYLERIYIDEIISEDIRKTGTAEKPIDQITLNLDRIATGLKYRKKIKKANLHIERALESHSRTIDYLEAKKKQTSPDIILTDMTKTIFETLSAIEIYREDSGDIIIKEQKILNEAMFELGEDYSEWYPKIVTLRKEGTEITKEIIDDLLEYYLPILHEITHNFQRDIQYDNIITLYPYVLDRDERLEFYKIRDNLANNELFVAASKLRFLFETFLRIFIKEELEYHSGKNWESLIPKIILNRCKSEMSKDMNSSPVLLKSVNFLDYSYLLDLKKIAVSNWDKFSGFFIKSKNQSEIEREKESFSAEIENINTLRKSETHSRLVGPEYKNIVTKTILISLERMSRINIERRKRRKGLDFNFNIEEILVDKFRSKEHFYVSIGSVKGYISEQLWTEFKDNEDVKDILLNNKKVTLKELEAIKLKSSKGWKDTILCFALVIFQDKYECSIENKYFIFRKK